MYSDLSDRELDIYSRQVALDDIGYEGQLRLRNSEVSIIGLGGLGSLIAQKCAGMGIGKIRLIDRDVVSRSDLHRQYLYSVDSIGLPKVEIAAKKLQELNPDVEILTFPESLNERNIDKLIKGVDVVLDGLDGPESRYIVNRICVRLNIPYIFGAAIQEFGNLSPIIPGQTFCLECFMPGLKDDDLPKCAVVGVHPSAIGIITSLQVYEAIRILTGKEPILKNKLFYLDLREMTFQTFHIDRSDRCNVCGSHPEGAPAPIQERLIQETCSRDGRRNFVILPVNEITLDIDQLCKIIKDREYKIKNQGELGIAYESPLGMRFSLLESGVLIVQIPPGFGESPLKDVLNEYRYIIVDCMGFAPEVVPDSEKDTL